MNKETLLINNIDDYLKLRMFGLQEVQVTDVPSSISDQQFEQLKRLSFPGAIWIDYLNRIERFGILHPWKPVTWQDVIDMAMRWHGNTKDGDFKE